MNIKYEVPASWYSNVYIDKNPCCSAARSFSMLNKQRSKECVLLIHGYRGYPGELVRPSIDLFKKGYDIYVPRLPGHGTTTKDFINAHAKDWMTLVKNALGDLKTKYDKVHIIGHSFGGTMAAILGSGDDKVGKLVYASPSFENKQMSLPARIILTILSPFVPKVRCKWHPSSKYHQHYENAPCDEMYLGNNYWKYFFTKQLLEYYKLLKEGLKIVSSVPHEHLVIYPKKDQIISGPSVELYKKALKNKTNIVEIENGTHCIFYDKDTKAEEEAVQAILKFFDK